MDEILHHLLKGDRVAAEKAAEKVPPRSPEAGLRGWIGLDAKDVGAFLDVLDGAEDTFRHHWQVCSGRTRSLKRAMVMTLLATLFAFAYQTNLLFAAMAAEKTTPMFFIPLTLQDVLDIVLTALTACIVLFAVFSLLEGRLDRRQARWQYFCAGVKRIFRNEKQIPRPPE